MLLRLDEGRTRDAHGILVGYLYIDADCLNQDLIARGLARADRTNSHALAKVFEQAEAAARKKQLGLWGSNPAKGQ